MAEWLKATVCKTVKPWVRIPLCPLINKLFKNMKTVKKIMKSKKPKLGRLRLLS